MADNKGREGLTAKSDPERDKDQEAESQSAPELIRRLVEIESALQELTAGEVDAVVDPITATPILLRRAQRERWESEARLRAIMEQLPAVVWTTDSELRYTSSDGAALRAIGLQPGQVVGQSLYDYPDDTTIRAAVEAHNKALQGEPASYSGVWEGRAFEAWVQPFRDAEGNILGCLGVALDVTERQAAENELQTTLAEFEAGVRHRTEELSQANEELRTYGEELREQNEQLSASRNALDAERRRYEDLFDFAPDGYIVTDAAGIIREVNRAAADLLHVQQRFLVGKPLMLFVASEYRKTFARHIELMKKAAEGDRRALGLPMQPRGGEAFDAAITVAPARDRSGTLRGFRWMIRDVTRQKWVEQERERLLIDSQEQRERAEALSDVIDQERILLQTIMDNTHAHLAYLDRNFNFIRVNSVYAEGSGYSPHQLIGRNHFDLFPHEENEAIFARVRDTGEPVRFYAKPFDYPERPELGMTYWDWTLVPVKDSEGQVQGLVFSLVDVTEHERTVQERERLLAENRSQREFLERLMETVPVGIAVVSGPDHRHQFVNPAYQRIPGMPVEMVGRTIAEVFPGVAAQGALDLVESAYATGQISSVREAPVSVGPGREDTYWDVDHVPMRGPSGAVESVLIIAHDVTEEVLARREAERRAQEQEAAFAAMAEAVIIYDAQSVAVRANPAAVAALGMDPVGTALDARLRRFSVTDLEGHPIPADRAPVSRALRGETVRGERVALTNADGCRSMILASASPLESAGAVTGAVLVWHDITEREQYLARLRGLLEASQELLEHTTVQGVLTTIMEAGRALIGANLGVSGHGYKEGVFSVGAVSCADGVGPCPPGESFVMERGGVYLDLLDKSVSLRLTPDELVQHPAWWGLPEGHAPLRGLLGARLVDRQGEPNGLLMVSDKETGDFTAEDEAVLSQLASIASLGLQHIEARAEAERRASELNAVFTAMTEGILVYDVERVLRMANPAAVEMFGFDPTGMSVAEVQSRLGVKQRGGPVGPAESAVERVLRGEPVEAEGYEFTDAKGSERIALMSASPLKRNGGIVGAVLALRDVTERERLLSQLDAEQARLRAIIENAPEGIVVADARARVLLANPVAERLYARPVPYGENFTSHASLGLCDPDGTQYDPRELPLTRAALDGETAHNVEMQIKWPDGQRRDLLVNAAPIRDSTGRTVGAVGVFGDITERNHMRRAIDEQATRLKALHEIDRAILSARSAEAIAQAALAYAMGFVNCTCASVSLFDFEREEMHILAAHGAEGSRLPEGATAPLSMTSHLGDLRAGEVVILEGLEAASSDVYAILRAEGVQKSVRVPLLAGGELLGSLNIGFEQSIAFSEQQSEILRQVADELAIGLYQARLDEQVKTYTSELERLVAERTAELEASEAQLRAIFDGSAIGIALADADGRIVGVNPAFAKMVGRNAENLPGVRFTELCDPESAEEDLARHRQLMEGALSHYYLDTTYVRPDGTIIEASLTATPLPGAGKRPPYALRMLEDITERKRAQQALMQAEKLSLIGRLAASIVHEVNNPLQSVIGCLGLAQEALTEGGSADRYIEISLEELRRTTRTMSHLRDVGSGVKPADREPTQLNDVIERALTLSGQRCRDRGIEVVFVPAKRLPKVRVARDQMEQVLLNLVLNAVDAMPDGGRLEVKTSRTRDPAGVAVTVADTGVGIPDGLRPHLFEAFVTTKEEGWGLGLHTSWNIVREHGGRIDVESEVGKGTTFTVWLPLK